MHRSVNQPPIEFQQTANMPQKQGVPYELNLFLIVEIAAKMLEVRTRLILPDGITSNVNDVRHKNVAFMSINPGNNHMLSHAGTLLDNLLCQVMVRDVESKIIQVNIFMQV